MTEFGFPSPHEGQKSAELKTCLLLEKRERSECSICCAQGLSPGQRPSRRPRSPSSNHNVKEPFRRRNCIFSPKYRRRQDVLRGGEERLYRGAPEACQTLKRRFSKKIRDVRARSANRVCRCIRHPSAPVRLTAGTQDMGAGSGRTRPNAPAARPPRLWRNIISKTGPRRPGSKGVD